jgi:hypothetical protein
MDTKQELAMWLEPWAAASERVECVPTEACLTAGEISDLVDETLTAAARERVAIHLSQCSFCAREVGALLGAAHEFDDGLQTRGVLGGLTRRLGARLHIFVSEARGAFTRADALIQEAVAAVRLRPVTAPAGLAWMAARGDEDEPRESDPEALHEVALDADWLPGVELLCGEENGGSVTVSLDEPWEVSLVTADGATHPLAVERGDDRYYAMITGIAPGEYVLTITEPESPPPSHPSA